MSRPERFARTVYISDDGNTHVCRTCSFRPGVESNVAATLVNGRWVVSVASADTVMIEPGGIVDTSGETNGSQIAF